ncbi:MAG: rRNA pseudouridine synthase [Hydrogenibacillus sp.]|nr:rRNA pseudouridine synthase [Hydrogenibacillus sp.]
MEARLQKILAEAGVSSRRKAEDLITAGRVRLNGEVAVLGMRADPDRDVIEVDGRPIVIPRKRYILLYKPIKTVTTMRDPQGRPTVRELLQGIPERVFPVGRLDFMTEGALLFTNDGDLTVRLLHPRYGVEKEYHATVKGPLPPDIAKRLTAGVLLDDGTARAVRARRLSETTVKLVLTEGRKHVVRRMLAALGNPVVRLVRTRFAHLTLDGLAAGKWRALTPDEVRALRRLVGLST